MITTPIFHTNISQDNMELSLLYSTEPTASLVVRYSTPQCCSTVWCNGVFPNAAHLKALIHLCMVNVGVIYSHDLIPWEFSWKGLRQWPSSVSGPRQWPSSELISLSMLAPKNCCTSNHVGCPPFTYYPGMSAIVIMVCSLTHPNSKTCSQFNND